MAHISNTLEFIKKAKIIHGNKYDYSNSKYNGRHSNISIICKTHGEFIQEAGSHLRGRGCIKCSGKYSPTTEEFIEKAKKIHGDKYNYSEVKYTTCSDKIQIICKDHGVFLQKPNDHLSGYGCAKCGDVYSPTTEEFIEKAKKIHGDKYNYSEVKYVNLKNMIDIICNKHGKFSQTPDNHLRGQGCRRCKNSKLENETRIALSDLNIKFEEQKSFENLKNKRLLKFDFYLPIYNILIECHGEQHFFDRMNIFNRRRQSIKITDNIKEQFCINNKIKLIIIYNNIHLKESKRKEFLYSNFHLLPLSNYNNTLKSINEIKEYMSKKIICYGKF